MDLSPVLSHLKSQLSGFKFIGASADLESTGKGHVSEPSCYLVPMSESAEENRLIGSFDQRLTVSFWVAIATSNRRDTIGAAAMGALEPLRDQVKGALLGWAPEPDIGEPIQFSGGHLLKFEDGLLWWVDEFHVTTYLRSI